jgi:hypothetical protein
LGKQSLFIENRSENYLALMWGALFDERSGLERAEFILNETSYL